MMDGMTGIVENKYTGERIIATEFDAWLQARSHS